MGDWEELGRRLVLGSDGPAPYLDVVAERTRQDGLWGQSGQDVASPNTPPHIKLAVLMEEVGEVAKAIIECPEDVEALDEELTQVAAVAMAWKTSLDR